jgi:hypothetical protein
MGCQVRPGWNLAARSVFVRWAVVSCVPVTWLGPIGLRALCIALVKVHARQHARTRWQLLTAARMLPRSLATTVCCRVVQVELAALGLQTSFEQLRVAELGDDVWQGVRNKYWHFPLYFLPLVRHAAAGEAADCKSGDVTAVR